MESREEYRVNLPQIQGEITGELLEVPNQSPSAVPQAKVVAATGGAGVGTALGIVLPWLFRTYMSTDMPVEVAIAFGGLFSTAGAFLAGYFMPPRSG